MYAQVPSCPALDAETRRDLAHRLFHLGALNFSGVRLKTGEITPVYFDIRLSMSDSEMLQDIARCMHKMITQATNDKFDLVTGVPAAAVPLATTISIQSSIPMILTRKAAKDYGTKKMIEGVWQPGQHILVVEDVVTYGDSIAETTNLLRSNGLQVKHAIVVVERQQGASQNLLENHDVQLHPLLTFDDILNILSTDGLIPIERVEIARDFISSAQFNRKPALPKPIVQFFPQMAARLSTIMAAKSTNSCLSIDLPVDRRQLLQVAIDAGPKIAALEIDPNVALVEYPSVVKELRFFAEKHNFLLIANSKMLVTEHDVRMALSDDNPLALNKWADIFTIHALEGFDALDLVRLYNESNLERQLGVLVVVHTESKNSLMDAVYKSKCVELAEKYADVVVGFVASKPLDSIQLPSLAEGDVQPSVIYKTPPIHGLGVLNCSNGTNNCNGTSKKDDSAAFQATCPGLLRTICLSSLDACNVDTL